MAGTHGFARLFNFQLEVVEAAMRKLVFLAFLFGMSGAAWAEQDLLSAKEDYITCWKQPCVTGASSRWSEKNPNGVAISVAMGVDPAVTDDQIKTVLSHDLTRNGVRLIQFFFEQNDTPASVIGLHVRGGSEGPYLIGNVREQIPAIAKRALNSDPLFRAD